ncbi:MAG: Methionine aminopeptidase [Candidatus Argoarchaeum ethanivorans]|uniref:Methionine aminopeptidase n=1 Tax=Candidatus Argoarchaeum ethanivorans TaxID=2608793 RepID=A0A811TE28_9EURY|nr:MAG: Methionine aminopeptidase [Candidatus Argoarchaeum ethanivorans]
MNQLKGLPEDETAEEILTKYIKAGRVASMVRSEAAKKVRVGASLLEVATFVEQRIVEEGCKPAFPVTLSLNSDAAHATPKKDDTSVFGEDVVKVDIGTHFDGYIGDTAVTVDLAGKDDLVKSSKDALESAIKILHAGINTKEIGEVIEEIILSYGYKPVSNLTGHGLMQYLTHTPPSIPNVKVEHGVVLEEGDIIAIEPFASDGAGRVTDGHLKEIYHLVGEKPIRHPVVRKVFSQIAEYKTLPFAKRWLTGTRIDFALLQLEKAGIVSGYPVLRDVSGGLVSQTEHTVIITENGCEVLTR